MKAIRVVLVLVGIFVLLSVAEYSTAPGGFICSDPNVINRTDRGWSSIDCVRKPGAISKILDVILRYAWDFFEAIGGFIARISDYLYWLEDYLWACYAIIERVVRLAFSWWRIAKGYFDYAWENKSTGRILLGTVLFLFAVEHWTGWLRRLWAWFVECCKEEEERYHRQREEYEKRRG